MNSSSHMDNLELIPLDSNCFVTNSPFIIDIENKCFLIADGFFIKTSCSKDSCYFLPTYNHEYSMKYISDLRIV
jgi:hypothetical protein